MMDAFLSKALVVGLLAGMIRLAAPVLAAAIGEILAERSGVLNLGLEGMMLCGAFTGFVVAIFSGNLWLGVMAAILVGASLGALHAVISITLRANQIVSGLAIVILGEGLVVYVFRAIFGIRLTFPRVEGFAPVAVPILSSIPILGPALFNQNALAYIIFLSTVVIWYVLYRTSLGLWIRGVGENPAAADAMGINVSVIRYGCVIAGGALAGLGGAFVTLGHLNMYVDNITAGRGWMALALVIFGRWNPLHAVWGALLFGFVDVLQFRIQNLGVQVPVQLLLLLPYVITIVILLGVGRRADMPRALTVPYKRGES